MTLKEWFSKHPDVDREAFGRRIKTTGVAVRRYELGERMPTPEIMSSIIRETKSQVTAQDILATRLAFIRRNKRSAA